jgi:hypothetical protein
MVHVYSVDSSGAGGSARIKGSGRTGAGFARNAAGRAARARARGRGR